MRLEGELKIGEPGRYIVISSRLFLLCLTPVGMYLLGNKDCNYETGPYKECISI